MTEHHQKANDPESKSETVRRNDRRRGQWRTLAHSLYRRRRRGNRRGQDLGRNSYVDWHEPWLLALSMAIIALCVADAFLTLDILERGGEELNPIMRWFLEHDSQVFIVAKLTMTATCLAFVIAHKRFRLWSKITGYQILWSIFFAYVGLITYQIGLLST